MYRKLLKLLLINFLLVSQSKLLSEDSFENLLNKFQDKQLEATELLREIESDLKNGLRINVCERQNQASILGLEAIEYLLQAYEISGVKPPLETIKANQIIWENLIDKC